MRTPLDLNSLEVIGDGTAVSLGDEPIDVDTYDFDKDVPSSPSNTVHSPHLVSVSFTPENALSEMIYRSDAIVGCVAWLTSEEILKWLAKKESVSLIVQKEDFLRPDLDPSNGWKKKLRRMYEAIPGGLRRDDVTFAYTDLSERSMLGDQGIDSVRCCGVYKREEKATPRMHHKFMVGLRRSKGISPDGRPVYYAAQVFTGSFNPTKNGTRSLENGVVITKGIDHYALDRSKLAKGERHPDIEELTTACVPHAFLMEWAHVLALSEPLDWRSEYVAPEWSLGT